jgi:hypothetical protein
VAPSSQRALPPDAGLRLGGLVLLLAVLLMGWLAAPRGSSAAAAPTLTTVAPALGTRAGGTPISITGTGFVAGATVTVGGVPATGVAVVSATQVLATTPVGLPGPAVIVVTNPDTQSGTLSNNFTYLDWPPTVTLVTANSGTSLGGTSVTITGTGFKAGATATFGGVAATSVTVVTDTSITAVTPAHAAGAVSVVVTNVDAQSGTLAAGYTYVAAAPPTVSSVTPSSGTTGGGTPITISGSNFATGATVLIGGTPATSVVRVDGSTITAVTPARTANVLPVVVTNPDGQPGTLFGGYTYVASPAPTVTTVSPTSGVLGGGTLVAITGTGFLHGATVTFGGTAATGVTYVSPTQLTVAAPAKSTAGAVSVEVKNTDLQTGTLATAYTYLAAPTVTSITPTGGPAAGGTEVTVTGTNFASTAEVLFGTTAATSVTFTSATEVKAVSPAGSGVVDVTVRNATGSEGKKAAAFTYAGPPTVTSMTPTQGPAAGGTVVTIAGTGLTTGATVTFNDIAGTSITVAADGKSVKATSPAHPVGAATVRVTSGTTALTVPGTFSYTSVPGVIVSGEVVQGGIALIVFSGGTNEQLVDAALDDGCPAEDSLVFYALEGGKWLPYIPAAPSAVNAAWNARYASGLPEGVALFVRCT